ncbi:9366_t:CDS:2 [Entrophospora sp. SA101]|nr:8554_t:CDS:2 [Entrophospora sp. SA101]CAJ0625577.1 9366_t:CDS:2 [Entrophospora sp. SA101]CAJ0837599.1 4620_t:CDS:2 [Entrophospora sp. SA101]CAJ0874691.1 2856_t:CDS:2 [Entrophospora sp. SA101]CAJ0910828.1 4185_t:CDS:2 [Entrophospora sp. SA101]
MVNQEDSENNKLKIDILKPELPHLVELVEKCKAIKNLTFDLLQKAERDLPDDGVNPTTTTTDPAEIDSTKLQLDYSFMQLRQLNRKSNLEKNSNKLATQEAKLEMDRIHLQLQDLNYMKTYLQREIRKCRSFRSIYQKIPLILEDEFKVTHPETINFSQPEDALNVGDPLPMDTEQ